MDAREKIEQAVRRAYQHGKNEASQDDEPWAIETETDRIIAIVREALRGSDNFDELTAESFAPIDAGIRALRAIPLNKGEAVFKPLAVRDSAVIMLDAMLDTALGAEPLRQEEER